MTTNTGIAHSSVLACDVIPREYAAKMSGSRQERKFRVECLRHYRATVRGLSVVHRAMRNATPEAIVVLAGLFERLIRDLRPCSCTVTAKMGMVCGEDDCPVHGFGE